MLTNSLCVSKEDSVYIATQSDICNRCLEEYATEHNCSYGEAREALKGKLIGQNIFKMQFHGAIFTLCKDHIQRIYELTNPEVEYLTVKFDELSKEEQESILTEVAGRLKDDNGQEIESLPEIATENAKPESLLEDDTKHKRSTKNAKNRT